MNLVLCNKRGRGAKAEKNKADKMSDLRDAIGMVMLRAQASPVPQVQRAMATLTAVQQSVITVPEAVMTNALTTLDLVAIKKVQKDLANHNPDSKATAIMKEVFRNNHVEIMGARKQFDMTEEAMKNMVLSVLMAEFGSDDGNISWINVGAKLLDIVANPQAVPNGADARGLGA